LKYSEKSEIRKPVLEYYGRYDISTEGRISIVHSHFGRSVPIDTATDFGGLYWVGRPFARPAVPQRVLVSQNRVEPRLCAVKTRRPKDGLRAFWVKSLPDASAAVTVLADANC
jgi:hypothetical protein